MELGRIQLGSQLQRRPKAWFADVILSYHSGATCNHLIPAPFLPDSLRFCFSPVPQHHSRSELSFSSASQPLAVQVWGSHLAPGSILLSSYCTSHSLGPKYSPLVSSPVNTRSPLKTQLQSFMSCDIFPGSSRKDERPPFPHSFLFASVLQPCLLRFRLCCFHISRTCWELSGPEPSPYPSTCVQHVAKKQHVLRDPQMLGVQPGNEDSISGLSLWATCLTMSSFST